MTWLSRSCVTGAYSRALDEFVELKVQGPESGADDVPVQLLAAQGELGEVDQHRLECRAERGALLVAQSRMVVGGGDGHGDTVQGPRVRVCNASVHLPYRSAGMRALPLAGGRAHHAGPARSRAGTPATCNAIRGCAWDARSVPLTCVIVDDNEEFLAAARAMLEREGISVVGVASTSAAAARQVEALHPDLVLVDIDLGEESGFDLVERLAEEASGGRPRTVLTSTHAHADFADLIEASPAVGFVAKAELSIAAIRAALGDAADSRTA